MKSKNGDKEDNKEDNGVQKEIIIWQIKKTYSTDKKRMKIRDMQKDMTYS